MDDMLQWIFFFDEGNVKSDITEEAEDERISNFMFDSPTGVLHLPGKETDLWVNLAMVKCVARTTVKPAEAAKPAELPAQDHAISMEPPQAG
jgi:hypothetical protein